MAKAKTEKIVFLGTGRRKKSIARVRLMPGTGVITVNGRELNEYFGPETLKVIVKQPLVATNTADKYDVIAKVIGGGISGQAGAIRHGISRDKIGIYFIKHKNLLIVMTSRFSYFIISKQLYYII